MPTMHEIVLLSDSEEEHATTIAKALASATAPMDIDTPNTPTADEQREYGVPADKRARTLPEVIELAPSPPPSAQPRSRAQYLQQLALRVASTDTPDTLRPPRTCEPVSFEKLTALIGKNPMQIYDDITLRSRNIALTDFVLLMDNERHRQLAGSNEDDSLYWATRPDWPHESLEDDSVLLCIGTVKEIYDANGDYKQHTPSERLRLVLPVSDTSTHRYLFSEDNRTYVIGRLPMRSKILTALRKRCTDLIATDLQEMNCDELIAYAASNGVDINEHAYGGDLNIYLVGTPSAAINNYASALRETYFAPTAHIMWLQSCDERNYRWHQDQKNKVGSEEEIQVLPDVDNVEEDEYSDERCDGDVEEAITWLRQHYCYIRVLLDRCLLADLCDDYCARLTELPSDYKFFRQQRIRSLAVLIADTYVLAEIDEDSLRDMYDMGFRGWTRACAPPLSRATMISQQSPRRSGDTLRSCKTPSALVYTTSSTSKILLALMPMALDLLELNRRTPELDIEPGQIALPFDKALRRWAVDEYGSDVAKALTNEQIIDRVLELDARDIVARASRDLRHHHARTDVVAQMRRLQLLMRSLIDNYYRNTTHYHRVDASDCKPKATRPVYQLQSTPGIVSPDVHCFAGICILRGDKTIADPARLSPQLLVTVGDYVELCASRADMMIAQVTRIMATYDEDGMQACRLHVTPLAPLTSHPITHGVSAKCELVVTPARCAIVTPDEIVGIVSNVVVARDNRAAFLNGSGDWLRRLMMHSARDEFFVRHV